MSKRDLLIVNGRIYTPSEVIDHGYMIVSGEKIKAVHKGEPPSIGLMEKLDAGGRLVLPGFIDIHVNGGGGSLAVDGNLDALNNIAMAHAKFGTTAIVPTTISVDEARLEKAVTTIGEAVEKNSGGAEILGVHLEGPFLSPAKSGAHRKEFLKAPSNSYFDKLYSASNGSIRMISLAPELDGSMDVIRHVRSRNVVACLAHSDADYLCTCEAIKNGMQVCAHIFNSMPPLTHRAPGPIGAFLTKRETFIELIADGFHVHPAVMEIAIKAKGTDGVVLVTDAVTPAGTSLTRFEILGTSLEVRGFSCFAPDGSLAGSALTLNNAVKVVVETTSTTLNDALKMASLNPARVLGIDARKGSLETGKDADILIAEEDLNVAVTMVKGRVVYSTWDCSLCWEA